MGHLLFSEFGGSSYVVPAFESGGVWNSTVISFKAVLFIMIFICCVKSGAVLALLRFTLTESILRINLNFRKQNLPLTLKFEFL